MSATKAVSVFRRVGNDHWCAVLFGSGRELHGPTLNTGIAGIDSEEAIAKHVKFLDSIYDNFTYRCDDKELFDHFTHTMMNIVKGQPL